MLPCMRKPQLPPQRPRTDTLPGLAPPLSPADLGLVRRELVYFREWLAEQIARLPAAAAAPAAPRPPGPGDRRRELQRHAWAVAAGMLLAVLLVLGSAVAALSWPAYGALAARAARLGAPSAPASAR
jgi:hypothetical protein